MRLVVVSALLVLAAACDRSQQLDAARQRRAEAAHDSAFAAVQARGEHAMGVDQYTSTHLFTPLPDGGRIELQRDQMDSAGTRQIRQHMNQIAAAFRSGNFALPGFVHGREVPGIAVMAAKRVAITYTVEVLPRGAALRLRSADPAAVQAIHEFLAFQRADHHASAHHGG
ncbi:MAG TPA: hypothetical protein VEL76_13800 [Gemmataceae bacterium]|nr:hypothetical protein [Gemmataceae bacterium]